MGDPPRELGGNVAQRLAEGDPRKIRIVVAHQPFGAMVPSDLSNLQHGAEPALQRWAAPPSAGTQCSFWFLQ